MSIIDTRTFDRDGFTIVVRKVADEDSNPLDCGDYPDDVFRAWQNNEWFYVGIVAMAYRNGVMLGESSLWACEDGHLPGVDGYVDAYDHTLGQHDNDYDVPGDAITEAKKNFAALLAHANEEN